jgi:hypothetical protein
LLEMIGWMCDLDDTRKDNVVELAATHLHQSAIAGNEIGKQPVRGAVKEKQKNVGKPNFSRRRCAA